jgi:hypothetical protein
MKRSLDELNTVSVMFLSITIRKGMMSELCFFVPNTPVKGKVVPVLN